MQKISEILHLCKCWQQDILMAKDFFLNIYYSFIWLFWVLAAACGTQFPDQGLNPGTPALGARSPSCWTTEEVPESFEEIFLYLFGSAGS